MNFFFKYIRSDCTATEEALTKASNKFLKRYLIVEKLAAERKINMKETPIEELDKLWNEAKQIIKSN